MLVEPSKIIPKLGLAEGAAVADFGVGSGHWAIALAERVGPKGKVYAIDVQKEMLESVITRGKEKGLQNIEVVWADFEVLGGSKLKDQSADFAVLANTLFQLEDKRSAASEIKRVLKPSGKLLVVDWSGSFGHMGPEREVVVAKDQGEKIFTEVGFKVDQVLDLGEYQWATVFRK